MGRIKKIERNFPIEFYLDWAYGITLEQIKKDISELEALGATHIDIDANGTGYGDCRVSITVYAQRLETNEEAKERVKKEKEYKESQKERDLLMLKALKEKYEGKE